MKKLTGGNLSHNMSKKVTIAIAQMQIKHQQPEHNIAIMEKFIIDAKKQHADVIVFPEDCIVGSIFGSVEWLERGDTFLPIMQALARKYRIDLIPGTWMTKTRQGNFSFAYYIDKKGKVLTTYNKSHLYLTERYFLSPGTSLGVCKTSYGTIGLSACWDIVSPSMFQQMVSQDVQIVFCPSAWYKEVTDELHTIHPDAESMHVDALCQARATENGIAFVYVNQAGKVHYGDKGTDTFIGHSQIVLPVAGAVTKANHNKETLLVHTIDLNFLNKVEDIYQIRKDLKQRSI